VSLSKRILFGDDPADDAARRELGEHTRRLLEPFKFKIPTRRRNRAPVGPYWDPIWYGALISTASELKLDYVCINSRLCTRNQADAEAIESRAREIHQQRFEDTMKLVARQALLRRDKS
jgi:hypothetical protein